MSMGKHLFDTITIARYQIRKGIPEKQKKSTGPLLTLEKQMFAPCFSLKKCVDPFLLVCQKLLAPLFS